jgi:hypothetical protein
MDAHIFTRKQNKKKRSCYDDQNLIAATQNTAKIAPEVRALKMFSTKPLPSTTN